MEAAVLMSGGIDSTILYAYAKRHGETVGVWYDFGQKPAAREKRALPEEVHRRSLPWANMALTKHGSGDDAFYLPGRNALLMLAMICHYRPHKALFGPLATECRPADVDKNHVFAGMLQQLASYVMTRSVVVSAPLAVMGFDKASVIQWARRENLVTEGQLFATYSCYEDTPLPFVGCGNCRQCLRRYLVLNSLGIKDPAAGYLVDPLRSGGADVLAQMIEQDRDELWGHMPSSSLGWAEWGLRAGAGGALREAMQRLLEERT